MDNLNIFVFLAIGVAALGVHFRKQDQLKGIITYLFIIVATFLMSEGLSGSKEADQLTYTLVTTLSLGFLLAQINWIRNNQWKWLVPLVLCVIPIWLGSKEFSYNNYVFSFEGPLVALMFLGAILDLIVAYKGKFIMKFLGYHDQEEINKALRIVLIGFAAFIGSFFASNYGIFLVALGSILSSFFRKDAYSNDGIALLMVSLSTCFLQQVGLESIDLSLGKVIEGLFFGVFAALVLHIGAGSKKYPNFGVFLGLLVACIPVFGLLMFVTQKTDLGGADAFAASFIGMAMAFVFIPGFQFAEILASFIITGGLLLVPMTENVEEQQLTTIEIPELQKEKNAEEEKVEDPFDLKNSPLDSIVGTYKIIEKTAQLNFQLGPKGGITKGSFKKFSGKITITESLENSIFSVELPVDQLTTFNRLRDESLMEKDYFNVGLYPLMKFESHKLEKKDDHYLLKGNFYMLGKIKPLDIKLKYIGKIDSNGEMIPVLVGKSTIDRTQFGMTPDSKEGNSVDFQFKVELEK